MTLTTILGTGLLLAGLAATARADESERAATTLVNTSSANWTLVAAKLPCPFLVETLDAQGRLVGVHYRTALHHVIEPYTAVNLRVADPSASAAARFVLQDATGQQFGSTLAYRFTARPQPGAAGCLACLRPDGPPEPATLALACGFRDPSQELAPLSEQVVRITADRWQLRPSLVTDQLHISLMSFMPGF